MSWLAQVFTSLKPHISGVRQLALSACAGRPVATSPQFRCSVRLALEMLRRHQTGAKIILHPGLLASSSPSLVLRCDASGEESHGMGAINVTNRTFFCQQWSTDQFARAQRALGTSSTYLEAVALLESLKQFATTNSLILAEVDSDNLRIVFAKGSSRCSETNLVLSDIALLLADLNSVLRVRQIPRDENQSSDCLSHLPSIQPDIDALRQLLIREFGKDAADVFIHNSAAQLLSH
jgi:hypothetical protein